MVMTDPIADMLTRVRNANSVKHESVDIPPRSTMKEELSRILKDEGLLEITKLLKMVNRVLFAFTLNTMRSRDM